MKTSALFLFTFTLAGKIPVAVKGMEEAMFGSSLRRAPEVSPRGVEGMAEFPEMNHPQAGAYSLQHVSTMQVSEIPMRQVSGDQIVPAAPGQLESFNRRTSSRQRSPPLNDGDLAVPNAEFNKKRRQEQQQQQQQQQQRDASKQTIAPQAQPWGAQGLRVDIERQPLGIVSLPRSPSSHRSARSAPSHAPSPR